MVPRCVQYRATVAQEGLPITSVLCQGHLEGPQGLVHAGGGEPAPVRAVPHPQDGRAVNAVIIVQDVVVLEGVHGSQSTGYVLSSLPDFKFDFAFFGCILDWTCFPKNFRGSTLPYPEDLIREWKVTGLLLSF